VMQVSVMDRSILTVAVLALSLVLGACNTTSPGASVIDAGPAADAEAGSTTDADAGPTCVPDGGRYTCLGNSWPVCPGSAQPDQPCDNNIPPCMGCSQGAGYTCACEDAGLTPDQDGALWSCIGTEYACQ